MRGRAVLVVMQAMLLTICALLAFPVLAGRTAPRAADGTRTASSAPPEPRPRRPPRLVSVLGLGDSVPEAAGCGCRSYVERVADHLATVQHRAVTADNLARGGLTSAGLLAQASARRLRADQGQVTVITIGANDFDSTLLSRPGYRAGDDLTGYQPAMQALRRNLSRLLATLASASAADHGPVLVTGYWNVFLDGRVGAGRGAAYQRDSDALTRKVNEVLAAAARSTHAVYIDLYTPFKGHGERDDTPLLADDGDHPSDLGHRLIARMVQQSLVHEGASAA